MNWRVEASNLELVYESSYENPVNGMLLENKKHCLLALYLLVVLEKYVLFLLSSRAILNYKGPDFCLDTKTNAFIAYNQLQHTQQSLKQLQ